MAWGTFTCVYSHIHIYVRPPTHLPDCGWKLPFEKFSDPLFQYYFLANVAVNSYKSLIMDTNEKQPRDEAPDELMLPDEVVAQKIYLIRGKKVMLDRDLAELYGVETKRLKEQVRRNIERFPEDFMFELTKDELENWRSQFATSNSEMMGLRYTPFAFTEHGVLMLSSVLNSKRAIAVNIKIMRIYTRLREMLLTNTEVLLRMERMDIELQVQGRSIENIYDALAEMAEREPEPREPVGFRLPRHSETNAS